MLSDDIAEKMTAAVEECESAREKLLSALVEAENVEGPSADELGPIGEALEAWRDGQQRFMAAVEESDVSDVATAAMLLKTNHGIDSTEARRGIPGVHVEGANQPFDVDLSGTRGSLLTTAAMEYVSNS